MRNIAGLAISLLLVPSFAQGAAGHILFAHNDVRIINASGQERGVKKGAELQEGDTVITGKTGAAQIRMVDGGFLAVRPNTQLKVDTFRYAGKTDGSEKGIFTLTKGTFRAITGAVGKVNKENYEVRTPGATIGIRGTDHEPMFIPMPLPGEIAIGKPGTYDKVNVGEALIKTSAGTAFVGANQAGFAAGSNAVPVKLPSIPAFYSPAPPPAQSASATNTAQTGGEASGATTDAATTDTATTDTATADATAADATAVDATAVDATAVDATAVDATAVDATAVDTTLAGTTMIDAAVIDTTMTDPTMVDATAPVLQPIATDPSVGGLQLTTTTPATHPAPLWAGSVGADMWIDSAMNMKLAGNGAMIVDGINGKEIQLGANEELISMSDADANGTFLFYSNTATLNGAGSHLMTDPGGNPITTITWGRWDNGFTVIDHGKTKLSIASFHYMYSPLVTTPTQMQNISGTFGYTHIPGVGAVTDQNGQLGNITSLSASVDFTNGLVNNIILQATTPGLTWSVTGTNMPIGALLSGVAGGAPISGPPPPPPLSGTCTGGACSGLPGNAKGNISGLFIGAAAQNAITSFSLTGTDSAGNGVAAMTGVSALKCTTGC